MTPQEIKHARALLLDCIADNMDVDEAEEIADSWSDDKVCRWIDRNWTGGLDGWSQRGELEYR